MNKVEQIRKEIERRHKWYKDELEKYSHPSLVKPKASYPSSAPCKTSVMDGLRMKQTSVMSKAVIPIKHCKICGKQLSAWEYCIYHTICEKCSVKNIHSYDTKEKCICLYHR